MIATFDTNVGTEQATGDVAADTNEFIVYLGKDGKSLTMRTPRASDEEEEE